MDTHKEGSLIPFISLLLFLRLTSEIWSYNSSFSHHNFILIPLYSSQGSFIIDICSCTIVTDLQYAGVFLFRFFFLNTSIPEILESKNLWNESLNKLQKNYFFEMLVLKYLKNPGTQTPPNMCPKGNRIHEYLSALWCATSELRV